VINWSAARLCEKRKQHRHVGRMPCDLLANHLLGGLAHLLDSNVSPSTLATTPLPGARNSNPTQDAGINVIPWRAQITRRNAAQMIFLRALGFAETNHYLVTPEM